MHLRLVLPFVIACAFLAGCGSHAKPWQDVHAVDTANNPGQGPCYSALNPDRTLRLVICQGDPGIGTCYDSGIPQDFTINQACGSARDAIEKKFHFHF